MSVEKQEARSSRWYDTRDGIATKLAEGLKGLVELARARGAHNHEANGRLREWIAAGRYWLDTFGQTLPITRTSHPFPSLTEIVPGPPGSGTRTFDGEPIDPNHCWTASFQRWAYDTDICPICFKGWTLENAWEMECGSEGSSYVPYHPECLRRRNASEEEAALLGCFDKAGFVVEGVERIANGYWGTSTEAHVTPWYRVMTSLGEISIGWRKRVINIDWTGCGLRLERLFSGDEVTHSATNVHAWGYDKAAEYLGRILQAAAYGAKQ